MFIRVSLHQVLKMRFGVNLPEGLPVSGGLGMYIDEPVFIESRAGENYRLVEVEYIKCWCLSKGVEWEPLEYDLVQVDDRKIEKVKIKIKRRGVLKFIPNKKTYYFDITECIVPKDQRKLTHRDFPKLINELDARDVVFRMDFDSEERRKIPPWSAQFGKGELEKKDDALWEQLFGGEISEEVALDAMTNLMECYYGMTYPISKKWNKK